MVRICILLCLLSIQFSASALTKLNASVNKNPVLQGEYFVLTLDADDAINGTKPDLSALLKDFIVGPTSVSSQTQIINGSVSKKTSWQTELMSRKTGQYQIPEFELNGVKSQPFTIQVKNNSTQKNSDDIFFKVSLTPESLYVQQAGVYTVKLYIAKSLSEGSLTSPMLDNTKISPLSKQTETQEIINGKRYSVISQDHLVQPQKSGEFTLYGPALNGRVRENYRSISVSAMAEEIKVTVKPIPAQAKGNWLPSELVTIHEQWQPDKDEFEIGTPITRTITLTALGITKEQLPEIGVADIEGIRSYPDQAENKNLVRDKKVISQRVESIALLPQKSGTYTLPEVKVPWFNTILNKLEFATLPARQVTITGNPAKSTPTVTTLPVEETKSTLPSIQQSNTIVTDLNIWLILPGYILWLLTLIAWYFHYKKPPLSNKENIKDNKVNNLNQCLKTLEKFAKSQDHTGFYQALSTLAKCQCNKETANISDLLNWHENETLKTKITELQTNLYSDKSTEINLELILKLLKNKKSNTNNADSKLTELY